VERNVVGYAWLKSLNHGNNSWCEGFKLKIAKAAARRFTVTKQCFQDPSGSVQKKQILEVLRTLGCVQIDSVNVVERSHYLAFWSRLGCYRKELLDQLLYPDRKVFEYWAHAASIIPIEHYHYFIPSMQKRRKEMRSKARQYLKEKANLLDVVLEEIKRNGSLCSKDFRHHDEEEKKEKSSGWWSWKPAKIALELLFDAGVLMVSRRENFQKYYDLAENVLPSGVDVKESAEEERQRFFLERTMDAWGLAEMRDFSQYFYSWSTRVNLGVKALSGLVKELESENVLTWVNVEGMDNPCLMLTKDVGDLENAVDAQDEAGTVSFISPFDNLTWSKPRTRKLFEFSPELELYVPKETRRFGYYTLNILYGSQIVGRLDPKMHRDKATLEIKTLELRDGFKPTKAFTEQLFITLGDFMQFHNAKTVRIAEPCPRFLKNIKFQRASPSKTAT
jgi:uncharacterized protein YcaQ